MTEKWLKTWEEPEQETVEWLLFSASSQKMKRCMAKTQEEALRIAIENGIEPGRTEHIRPSYGRSWEGALMDNSDFFRKMESLR